MRRVPFQMSLVSTFPHQGKHALLNNEHDTLPVFNCLDLPQKSVTFGKYCIAQLHSHWGKWAYNLFHDLVKRSADNPKLIATKLPRNRVKSASEGVTKLIGS